MYCHEIIVMPSPSVGGLHAQQQQRAAITLLHARIRKKQWFNNKVNLI